MQRLDEGVYLELDCIHFDREELCASYKLKATDRNMRRLAVGWLLDWLDYQYRPQGLFDLPQEHSL